VQESVISDVKNSNKMALTELDSFYLKFKNLLIAEKDAILTLKSETGRSHVTLSVDLGHVHSNTAVHPPHHTRNGTARTRRRERRAEARQLAAEEATAVAEKADVSEKNNVEVEKQEKPSSEIEEATASVVEVLENSTGKVSDELCSDEEYNSKVGDTEIYEFECWDPRDKWEMQDVFNHMGEALELMFECFKVKEEEQKHQLDVGKKMKETSPIKLKIKKSKNLKHVMDNFQREGYVKGGGCVKFQCVRKIL
jgi:hypothetical protein